MTADKAMALAYIRLAGFDPMDVQSVTISPKGLDVVVLNRDEDGQIVLVDEEVAHEVRLPWDR